MTTDLAYKDTFHRCFKLTGALITADGTDDKLIRPMRGLDYTVPASIIDLTIERIIEQQINFEADVAGDPEDENDEREIVEILGEVVDAALDTEDTNAVINLLLERPSAIVEEQDENHQMNENAAVATAASVAAEEEEQQQQQEEKEEEKDENEEESWAMDLAELQEGALKPILDTTMARPRIGKGVFFMILVDAE